MLFEPTMFEYNAEFPIAVFELPEVFANNVLNPNVALLLQEVFAVID
jgi:hypothetical protein